MSSDPVDIRLFGASTYLSDNTDAIQQAIDSGHPVYIPYGGSKKSAFKFERRLKLRPGTVVTGGGTNSILEFTESGVAIDDIDYGPATHSILCGFKLQASNEMATVGIQMTNAKNVLLENLWIEGGQLDPHDPSGETVSQRVYWSIAGLSILGVVPSNTYDFRIAGCNISGCKGDGIFVKDDSGTGGLHVLHSRIQGCKKIGFNQVFGIEGPEQKCQVHVEGNDIEGNAGGQINCDSLCGSTFKDNHFENQRTAEGSTVTPMIFGSRVVLEPGTGIVTGKDADFIHISKGDTLTLSIDDSDDIKITFLEGDTQISKVIDRINSHLFNSHLPFPAIASNSGDQLRLTTDKDRKFMLKNASKDILRKLGLTAWRGQFFGLSITGNYINGVFANWGIEFPSTSGSNGIIVSGNLINGNHLSAGFRKEPIAAIISRPQHNISIQGNSCTGAFDVDAGGWAYANYEEPYWFSGPYSLYGQDKEGHQLLGDLRFGITNVTSTVIIDETHPDSIQNYNHIYGRSYSFHFKSASPIDLPLPAHKKGKRLLFKNENVGVAKLIPRSGFIDGSSKPYELTKYAFLELEDDGKDYWIIGSGNGGP